MEPRVEIKEHMRGGKGHVIMKHLLGEKELNGKCRIYAEITLEPGCEIGYHEHHNESETYYIISGQGVYNDNGTNRPVSAEISPLLPTASVTAWTTPEPENLVLMALVILD